MGVDTAKLESIYLSPLPCSLALRIIMITELTVAVLNVDSSNCWDYCDIHFVCRQRHSESLSILHHSITSGRYHHSLRVHGAITECQLHTGYCCVVTPSWKNGRLKSSV